MLLTAARGPRDADDMASYLLRWLLALQCVLLAVTPARAGVTARHSELLERDATGRVISASATSGPRGTAPDLWRGYRYSSLGRLDRVFKSLPLEPTNGVPLDTSSLGFLPVGSSGVADFADDLGPSATGDAVQINGTTTSVSRPFYLM